ncbi:MAG: type II toxin-antitoxin system PemK/MazF family toxin, partial [Gallionellaceae bacterium]
HFHPDYGTILICDFGTGFKPPEMVKKRPVLVVSHRRRWNSNTVTVVPLSTKQPTITHDWHHLVDMRVMPINFQRQPTWAKCDMLTTVALWRLDRVMHKVAGKRSYVAPKLGNHDMRAIKTAIQAHLHLT